MQNFELIVDFNGIVIFDPSVLAGYFCEINLGDNLYARFVGSDEGERVVEQGIVLPVLGLDDGICSIILRTDKCLVPCDHIPRRSWPLFRAKAMLNELIAGFSNPGISKHQEQFAA